MLMKLHDAASSNSAKTIAPLLTYQVRLLRNVTLVCFAALMNFRDAASSNPAMTIDPLSTYQVGLLHNVDLSLLRRVE